MNTVQRYFLSFAFLVFATFSSVAQAEIVLTNKITSYQTYSNASGEFYSVKIGGYTMSTKAVQTGTALREAFLRKLTITVEFELGSFIPNYGYVGNTINSVTIQSINLP